MIHILTTGGTIGSRDIDIEKDRTVESPPTIEDFLDIPNVSFEFRIDPVFDKDSRSINQNDREKLSREIKSSIFEKILVTHGTYTMEDTGHYLAGLNFNKTIVLVGSMILGAENKTDVPFNLGYAIAALQFLKPGVYIAMHGKVFHWDNVYKDLTENKFKTLRS